MIFFQSIAICFFLSDLHLSAIHALETCQTTWFDNGDVSREGDSELLADLKRKHGLRICSDPVDMEAQTVSGIKSDHIRNIFHTHNAAEGLLCLNSEQSWSPCEDYKVKFTCSGEFCSECQTKWFDLDDPEGHGDFELLSDLLHKFPGDICPQPIAIQAQTVSTDSASSPPETFLNLDAMYGFACLNADQVDKSCEDYKVRFTCPKEFCQASQECRTRWLSSDDDQSDVGDVESLYQLMKTYPGQVCKNPIQIEARTKSGLPSKHTGDIFLSYDVTFGFACINENQKSSKQCEDYEVLLTCPSDFCRICRTDWFDLDNPTNGGDYETLVKVQRLNTAGVICAQPVAVEAMTVSGIPAHKTGDVFQMYDATQGFACVNDDQPGEKQCEDYKVRFTCPPDFCA
ncbi:transmembrane protein 269 isoform X1 [Syngnathus acus]|uniref:transmembrane protein 269 isoform X1 n=1 Tax=Syngnathus acus TaxID=161584 RepID=UPI00188632FC|nr:transmembrane protein 269 isoform X1 [Syngnathus acus]XP_037134959.1 transmembrane protein 269 isoform X1 [Syngnathus acus]XP_037134960.1 transmembrane protein 269 isoform X1 [Syngnathus acus]XP_037134961.1 transmembrane protein 269 isoform X1 [Syngnathus acus]